VTFSIAEHLHHCSTQIRFKIAYLQGSFRMIGHSNDSAFGRSSHMILVDN